MDKKAVYIVILLVVVGIVFANCLANGFVWDDNIFTVANSVYRNGDLRSIFFSPANRAEYLPVRDLSLVLDCRLWGDTAVGFHLSNLVIYAAAVISVYLLALQLFRLMLPERHEGQKIAGTIATASFIVALLFAVHPLHSQVVAWVTGRNALLSGLFFFLSCNCYLLFLAREGSRRYLPYAGALFFFLLALFSKATAIMLPLVFVILLPFTPCRNRRSNLVSTVPFCLLAGTVALLFVDIGRSTRVILPTDSFATDSLVAKIAVALQIPFFYLWKLAIPLNLAPEYAVGFNGSLRDSQSVAAGVGLVLLILAAILLRRKFPTYSFSVGLFLVGLLPVMNFFHTNPVVADRYVFFSSFAFCFLIGSLFLYVRRLKYVLVAFMTVLTIAWGGLAVRANAVWKSDETLWSHAVVAEPKAPRGHYQLGYLYIRTGRTSAALAEFAKAQELSHRRYHDYFLGYQYFNAQNYDAALMLFKRAVAEDEGFYEALFQLGFTLEIMGKRQEAAEYYRRTIASPEVDDLESFKQNAEDRLRRL